MKLSHHRAGAGYGDRRTQAEIAADDINAQSDRDRAVIARIGGRLSVGLFRRMGWDADAEREATEGIHRTQEARRTFAALPEAAFDWPIYVEATRGYGLLKAAEVEALHRYGERVFGDAWWPGQSREGYPSEDAALLDDMGYFESEDQA